MSSNDYLSDDDEYEEETVHVILDLGTSFPAETLEQMASENAEIQVLDLESGTPFIKVGDAIFRGNLDETATTNLLFEITERKRDTSGLLPLLSTLRGNNEASDPQIQQNVQFQRLSAKYMTEADKIISCQRVTLMPKAEHELVIRAPSNQNENIADLLAIEDEPME